MNLIGWWRRSEVEFVGVKTYNQLTAALKKCFISLWSGQQTIQQSLPFINQPIQLFFFHKERRKVSFLIDSFRSVEWNGLIKNDIITVNQFLDHEIKTKNFLVLWMGWKLRAAGMESNQTFHSSLWEWEEWLFDGWNGRSAAKKERKVGLLFLICCGLWAAASRHAPQQKRKQTNKPTPQQMN